MARNNSRSAWGEVQDQISEWWEDLSENDLALIDHRQEQGIDGPQNPHEHARSLAFMKVKVRLTNIRPRGAGRKNRAGGDFGMSQYPGHSPDDWQETNYSRGEKSRSGF